jgi:hypothetical protein
MLAALVRKAELGKAGVSDPFEAHRQRPLREHLDDYGRHLSARGDTAGHVARTCTRVRAVLDGTRAVFVGDLSASAVAEYLAELRRDPPRPELPQTGRPGGAFSKRELAAALGVRPHCIPGLVKRHRLAASGNGKARLFPRETALALAGRLARSMGPATVNHYVRAVKSFSRWLVRDRRTGADPLAGLSGVKAGDDVRRGRRALPPEDLAAVLAAARASAVSFRGLAGTDRYYLYLTACSTGFRAGELASLTPESFDLDAEPPTATVRAAYDKRRRPAVQPLPPDVAEALRDWLPSRPACPCGRGRGRATARAPSCCASTWTRPASPTPSRGRTARCTPTFTPCVTATSRCWTGPA